MVLVLRRIACSTGPLGRPPLTEESLKAGHSAPFFLAQAPDRVYAGQYSLLRSVSAREASRSRRGEAAKARTDAWAQRARVLSSFEGGAEGKRVARRPSAAGRALGSIRFLHERAISVGRRATMRTREKRGRP